MSGGICNPSMCFVAIAAGDAMWQKAGLSVGCLVNALRAHRDALAAGGRIPTALDSATAWAWQSETPPPAGSALAALRHYAVELLATFRCVAMGLRSGRVNSVTSARQRRVSGSALMICTIGTVL